MIKSKDINDYIKLPAEIMLLNLNPYEMSIYTYILYLTRAHDKQESCHPSFSTIGKMLGINKNTVMKYVRSLEDKELISTYTTKVYTKDGKVGNGNLRYYVRPLEDAVKRYKQKSG